MGHDVKVPLVVSCALAALILLSAPPAYAAKEHLYDPALSLTGSTSTSAEDLIPDPGPNHPAKSFATPCGVVTDSHGDIYVASSANGTAQGRIDVFDPSGHYLTEIPDEYEPCGLAVDSEGNLYVRESKITSVALFKPTSYPPSKETEYSNPTYSYTDPDGGGPHGDLCLQAESVAVDPSNDHLYVGHRCWIEEYGSAAEGSPLIRESIGAPVKLVMMGIDVSGSTHDVYATRVGINEESPKVFVFDGASGNVECEVDGSETPAGSFDFGLGASIAVDQANGDFYVWDYGHKVIDQFGVEGKDCKFIGRLPKPPELKAVDGLNDLAVDDPFEGQKLGEGGYDSPNAGHVYVTSGTSPSSFHLFAYRSKIEAPPTVKAQAAVEVSETEAVLRAELNPGGLATTYRFEYTTQTDFEAQGYEGATRVPVTDADAGQGGAFILVSEQISGLDPGEAYRFRLAATNAECPAESPTEGEDEPGKGCEEGKDASFSTYAPAPIAGPCPNEAMRTGPSSALPDCRAYELVTPPDTNGRIPTMAMLGRNFGSNGFETPLASPGGTSVAFGSNSGSLPGIGGGGYQDTYEALRDESSGWQSRFTGMSGAQTERDKPGGISVDHGYAFQYVPSDNGSLAGDGYQYLHVPAGTEPSFNCAPAAEPEGRFEWVGCGSLGFDPYAEGRWISPGGGHVVFETGSSAGSGSVPVQLESCAPPSTPGEPVRAIYDRTPGGATRCVSVPPVGSSAETEAAFESVSPAYLGTSADGTTTAFTVGQTTYAGVGNEETVGVATGSTAFGGISRDGSRVFYLKEPSGGAIPRGEIYACEVVLGPCAGTGAQAPIQIGSGGESTLVNVSSDGSHVYFVSKKALTPGEENEAEEEAEADEENLYVWDGAGVRFIAIVEALDVSGEFSAAAHDTVGGLGLWTGPGKRVGSALDPSRTSPDGEAFVFESHADLTAYESGGKAEVYRYDASAPPGGRLRCVSCNPTGAEALSDAQLQSDPSGSSELYALPPVNEFAQISNVSSDGSKAFFQSADRLVPSDHDGKVDVYEWEAQGTGGCKRQAGCLSLISGGRGVEDDYLYAATPDGHDVFFLGADRLAPQDPDGTPSIYDARVEGGFPAPGVPPAECLGESCQPAVVAPNDSTPASLSFQGAGNLKEGQPSSGRCPKGKRKVKTRGKARCVKRQVKKHRHGKRRRNRANASRGTAR